MKTIMTGLTFLLIANVIIAQPEGSTTRQDFLKMANYLEGEWYSPSASYDSKNPTSSKGFGLWFTLELKENLLRLTHAVFRGDTAHITGESYWLWHPGEQKIKYYSIGLDGGVTEGETYFTSSEKFTTTGYSYSPDGTIKISRDQNVVISTDEHTTTTSDFEKNIWKETGNYQFRKSDAKEHYTVVRIR